MGIVIVTNQWEEVKASLLPTFGVEQSVILYCFRFKIGALILVNFSKILIICYQIEMGRLRNRNFHQTQDFVCWGSKVNKTEDKNVFSCLSLLFMLSYYECSLFIYSLMSGFQFSEGS